MKNKTFAKILLPLVFLTFTLGCSTVKGWFGKKAPDDRPPEVLAEKGIKDLKKKNYDDASYSFGVAAHYISDTFSSPHCVSKESGKDHHNYEIVADEFTPKITYLEGDLDTQMKKGIEQGKADWTEWKKTQDRTIIQAGVDRGASATYTAIKNTLS